MSIFGNLLVKKCGASIVALICCLLPAGVNGQGGNMGEENSAATIVSSNQSADAVDLTRAPPAGPPVPDLDSGRPGSSAREAPGSAGGFAEARALRPGESPRRETGNILVVQIDKDEFIVFIRLAPLAIWVGKYEVTNAQYQRFDRSHDPKKYYDNFINLPDQPAVQVSWEDANNYCGWLSRNCRRQLPEGCEFRLPAEKEWIAFALCGREKEYPWGNQWPPPNSFNYKGTEGAGIIYSFFQNEKFIRNHDDGFVVAAPVGKSGINEWGLYGVGGNVWEWCRDWSDETKTTRVLKGAAWNNSAPVILTVNHRSDGLPEKRNVMIGFRVVIAPRKK